MDEGDEFVEIRVNQRATELIIITKSVEECSFCEQAATVCHNQWHYNFHYCTEHAALHVECHDLVSPLVDTWRHNMNLASSLLETLVCEVALTKRSMLSAWRGTWASDETPHVNVSVQR